MNEFQHNNKPQEQEAVDLLKSQNRRLAKQQIIYAILFFALVAVLSYYVFTKVVYATYDGYITLDDNKMRACDDLLLLKINKNVGDTVQEGDTLYSYVLLSNILDQYDFNTLPTVVRESHDMELQAKLAQQEIPVLRTKLAELRKQQKGEQKDIYFGLTDNTRQNQLAAQIAETEEELRKQMNKVAIYASMKNNTWYYMANRNGNGHDIGKIPQQALDQFHNSGTIHYCIAPKNAFVTDINVTERAVVFKQEPIMSIQHKDYESCHLGVVAYVPSDKVKYLESPADADVIINSDVIVKAKLTMVGLRVEEIPKYLQGNFTHDANAVVGYFTFNPYQHVPEWAMTNKLPVRIRINKLKAMSDPKPLPEYIIPDERGNIHPPKSKAKNSGKQTMPKARINGKQTKNKDNQ